MSKLFRSLMSVALLMITMVSLTACRNTAEGVGKDTEKAGEKIQDATK